MMRDRLGEQIACRTGERAKALAHQPIPLGIRYPFAHDCTLHIGLLLFFLREVGARPPSCDFIKEK
jgi:hypothetical protein